MSREKLSLAFDKDKETALHFAAKNGNLDLVIYLLKEGADINAKNADFITPLHYAVMNGHSPVVATMLERNASVEVADGSGQTPLHHAVIRLIDTGNKPTEGKIQHVNSFSMEELYLDVVKRLMHHGASPICKIANAEMWEHCKLLVEMGGTVNSLSDDQKVRLLCYIANLPDIKISSEADTKIGIVLYNTIRLNNVDLLKLIFDTWQIEYSHVTRLKDCIDKKLSEVYEELKYKGVALSKAMEFVIEDRLINAGFFTYKNDHNCKEVVATIDTVRKRAELVCNRIWELRDRYSDHCKKEIDCEFIQNCRFIAQNIHILKRQLKWTYDRLPWEEMELCTVSFIHSLTKTREFNVVSRVVLNADRLLQHLVNFGAVLQNEIPNLKIEDAKSLLPRNTCMASVKSLHPSFGELYEDHEKLKTVYSLKRIESYIELAVEIDLEERRDVGKLVIERTLQVIGECLKNTLESPNISDTVHKSLLSSAPRNLREIITGLRDSLSHAHTLSNKMAVEESKNPAFFSNVQNDLKKIAVEVGCILYERKMEAIQYFLMQIIDCKDIVNLKEKAKVFEQVSKGEELHLEIGNPREMDKVCRLIDHLKSEIMNQTDVEIGWFKEMEEIVSSYRSKLRDAKYRYFSEFSATNHYICNAYDLKTVKNCARSLIKRKVPRSCRPTEIMPLLRKIYDCRPENVKLAPVFCALYCCVTYEGSRIGAIDEFKAKLEQNDTRTSLDIAALSELENNLEDIVKDLPEKDKCAVRQNWQNKTDMHFSKTKLSGYLAHYDSSLQLECKELFDSFKFKKVRAKKFSDMFSKGDFNGCKKFVDDIRDEYQVLIGSVRNAITEQRFQDIRKILTDYVKSIVKNVYVQDKSIADPLQNFFQVRLELLKALIRPYDSMLAFIDSYKQDRALQMAVEMLVLDLTEILENLSLFADNRLFLDRSSPILIGKSLRNYLAHGDWLIDTLPFDTSLSVVSSAFKFVYHGNDLITNKNALIGLQMHGDADVSRETIRQSQLLASIVQQENMFTAAREGDLDKVKDCIKKGGDTKARSTCGWTILQYAACGGVKDVLQYFLDENVNISCGDLFYEDTLYIAAAFGNYDIVKYLVEDKKAKLDRVYGNGQSLLHVAAQNSCGSIMMLFLSKDTLDINAVCESGKTPLHYAALRGNEDIICMLIEKGADVDGGNKRFGSPLYFAALNGHTDVALELINKGANVNSLGDLKLAPLHCAAMNGHKDVVAALLNRGACVDGSMMNIATPLFLAIDNGHFDVVQVLLEKGANIDNPDGDGMTYLHCAAEHGHKEIVLTLLEHGAIVDAAPEGNRTPLFDAAENGHYSTVLVLLGKGAMVNASTETGVTPLHVSAMNGHNAICVALIENGATVDCGDENGFTALHVAAEHGHKDVVLELLARGADVNSHNVEERTPLFYAVKNDCYDVVWTLIQKGNSVHDVDKGNVTALHVAALNGNLNVVQLLLEHGAMVNARADGGITPLHGAAGMGHEHIVRALLNNGASVDLTNNGNVTPLHHAAETGQKDIVCLLAEEGASVNALFEVGHSPLLVAAENGHKAVVVALLAKGARIDTCGKNEESLLCIAAEKGYKDVVVTLLDKGADIDNGEMSPLFMASVSGHADIVTVLLDKGADVNVRGIDCATPLYVAVLHDHVEVSLVLLQRGCDVNAENNGKLTALHCAAIMGTTHEVVEGLLAHGANVNAQSEELCTPLHFAAMHGHSHVAFALLQNGAGVDVTDNKKCTALFYAAECGGNEVTLVLLASNAQVNIRSENGLTPLHYAALNGHQDVCVSLLTNGADVNAKEMDGLTAVHYAAAYGHNDVVILLLDHGACINVMTNTKMLTPLHLAADKGNEEVAMTLLRSGATVDVQDMCGMTPLHLAVKKGNEGAAVALLAGGADANFPIRHGDTPLHVAALVGHAGVVEVLLSHGAMINAQGTGMCTALHIAAGEGSLDVVNLLLDKGALVDVKDKHDITPLHYAAKHNHTRIVLALLYYKAPIDSLTNVNLTPLHFAAGGNCLDALNALLDKGADVDSREIDNYTALHMATISGHTDAVVALMTHGADIEAVGLNNVTALHIAADLGHSEIVVVLLEKGANVKAVTVDNHTPLQLAIRSSHWNIAVSLTLYGKFLDVCEQHMLQ